MTKKEMATDKQKQCIQNYIWNDNDYAIKLLGDRKIKNLSKKEAWGIINKTVNHYELMMAINDFVDTNPDFYDNY